MDKTSSTPLLFSEIRIRELTLKNRVVISPMCQHAADADGAMTDWHLVHLGKFALGGAALIFTESTAVERRGRIGIRDVGLWSDTQAPPLKRVVDFVHEHGAAFGVQLAHAGRKAATAPLWDGGEAIPAQDLVDREGPWTRVGPSSIAAGPKWTVPEALDEAAISAIGDRFVAAARRVEAAGADVIELHFGHGYLVASFLSPLSNHRNDRYGGDLEGRMRLAIEIAERVREVWPCRKPLFCRLSVVDGAVGGWSVEDSIVLARRLARVGVDVIDCSSGGLTEDTRQVSVPRGPGFQVPFAERIRSETGVLTQAVGMIFEARQAEAILKQGQADLIAIARQALFDPYWTHHAAQELGSDPAFRNWPQRHGAWLAKRAPMMAQIEAESRSSQSATRQGVQLDDPREQ